MIREGRPFPPSWPELLTKCVEITFKSQEAGWLQTSAHKLPYVLAECYCDIIHKNPLNIEAFRKVFSQEIFKPLAEELQKDVNDCHSLIKKSGVHLDNDAPKRSAIRKETKFFTLYDRMIIDLISKLDDIIWQAEILCSLGFMEKGDYQDLRHRWQEKIKDIIPKIRKITVDIIVG